MNDYDKAARFAARRLDPIGFLLWLMGEVFGQVWRWVGWLDTQAVPFPGEPDRRCDTVAAFERLVGDQPPLALVVEFMTETRRAILERLVGYELHVRFEVPYQKSDPTVLYDVCGVVVNLTGESLTGEWSMAPADCGGLGLWSKAGVRNLEALEATTVLGDIASGKTAKCVLPWVALMKGGDRIENIAEWKRLAEEQPDLETRRLYAALVLVFAGRTRCQDVWKKQMEGWMVTRSPITLEWEAEGELRGIRRSLLRVLKAHLRQEVPQTLVQAIESQENLSVLETWLEKAVTVASFDEMQTVLGQNRQ